VSANEIEIINESNRSRITKGVLFGESRTTFVRPIGETIEDF
jgi:hypothetical protein